MSSIFFVNFIPMYFKHLDAIINDITLIPFSICLSVVCRITFFGILVILDILNLQ